MLKYFVIIKIDFIYDCVYEWGLILRLLFVVECGLGFWICL